MANTVNLGSVVGPAGQKPSLTYVNNTKDITENLDSKNRINVTSLPLVTGFKYLLVELLNQAQTGKVRVYMPNTDTFIGELVLSPLNPAAEGTTFVTMLHTPFQCSISTEGISSVKLIENGSFWY